MPACVMCLKQDGIYTEEFTHMFLMGIKQCFEKCYCKCFFLLEINSQLCDSVDMHTAWCNCFRWIFNRANRPNSQQKITDVVSLILLDLGTSGLRIKLICYSLQTHMFRFRRCLDLMLLPIQAQHHRPGKALALRGTPLALCYCRSPKSMWMARGLLLKISASLSIEVR